ncbi:hypothetical protein AB1Y20_020566 [Prymnesium parvum]|uniref:Uncharacterized protein n=1 Tax=Prymnesium parvum TaxID=97485 RepID=A0AB34JXZ3_PRYPA
MFSGFNSIEDLVKVDVRHLVAEERRLKGKAKAPEREEKLQKKRGGRAKKAAERERLLRIELATIYSALKNMMNDELSDQLKLWKLVENKTGFTVGGSRVDLVLKLQGLIFERFGTASNDLPDGDAGTERGQVDGRRRQRKVGAEGTAKGRKRKRAVVELHGWEWDPHEEFEIERLMGKMVSDGATPVPGREGEHIASGTILYRVLWECFPPEIATWAEEEDQIPCGEIDFIGMYEDSLGAEEQEQEDSESDEQDE